MRDGSCMIEPSSLSTSTPPLRRGAVSAIARATRDGTNRPGERLQEVLRSRHPTEDAALSFDHLERGLVEAWEIGRDAILEHQAVVAAIVGLAHGRVYADLR